MSGVGKEIAARVTSLEGRADAATRAPAAPAARADSLSNPHLVDTAPPTPEDIQKAWADLINIDQIVYALERARDSLRLQADQLHDAGDYDAEFPAGDADRMSEAIAVMRSVQTGHPAVFVNPPAIVLTVRRTFWEGFWDGLGLGPVWRRLPHLPRAVKWFAEDWRVAYCAERASGRWGPSAAIRAAHFAATTPF